MIVISAIVGSTFLFDRELCAGVVVAAGDVDINEAYDVNVWGFVCWSWTEILFEMDCLG